MRARARGMLLVLETSNPPNSKTACLSARRLEFVPIETTRVPWNPVFAPVFAVAIVCLTSHYCLRCSNRWALFSFQLEPFIFISEASFIWHAECAIDFRAPPETVACWHTSQATGIFRKGKRKGRAPRYWKRCWAPDRAKASDWCMTAKAVRSAHWSTITDFHPGNGLGGALHA